MTDAVVVDGGGDGGGVEPNSTVFIAIRMLDSFDFVLKPTNTPNVLNCAECVSSVTSTLYSSNRINPILFVRVIVVWLSIGFSLFVNRDKFFGLS